MTNNAIDFKSSGLTEIFQQSPFNLLKINDRKKLAQTFRVITFLKDDYLIQQNQRISFVGLIVSGTCDLMIRDTKGREYAFQTIQSGDYFGILSFFTGGSSMMSALCKERMQCYIQTSENFSQMLNNYPEIKNYFYQIAVDYVYKIYETVNKSMRSDADNLTVQSLKSPAIKKALHFIDQYYMQKISLDMVTENCGMSKYHFSRTFKQETGLTYKAYLIDKRIQKAKELMKTENMNVSQACFHVGFNDLSHFCRIFQRSEGMTPSYYRKNILTNSKKILIYRK